MSKTTTIEDVRGLIKSADVLIARGHTTWLWLHIGQAREVLVLAERALTMPEGLDERARETIGKVLTDVPYWMDYFEPQPVVADLAHTIRAMASENANLHAGIKQLGEQWSHGQDAIRSLEDQVESAEAEVERLRGALEKIRDHRLASKDTAGPYSDGVRDALKLCGQIATAALTKGPDDADR